MDKEEELHSQLEDSWHQLDEVVRSKMRYAPQEKLPVDTGLHGRLLHDHAVRTPI